MLHSAIDEPYSVSTDYSAVDIDQDSTVGDRTFAEFEGYRAITSLGALLPGHTLVCPPQTYVQRFGAVSMFDVVTESDTGDALLTLVERVSAILRSQFQSELIYFEHGGSSRLVSRKCHTCFPHLHMVPVSENVRNRFRSTCVGSLAGEFEAHREFRSLKEFFSSQRGLGEYLLVHDGDEGAAMWAGDRLTFRSGALRHIVQYLLGHPPDNWRTAPGQADAVRLAKDLAAARRQLTR